MISGCHTWPGLSGCWWPPSAVESHSPCPAAWHRILPPPAPYNAPGSQTWEDQKNFFINTTMIIVIIIIIMIVLQQKRTQQITRKQSREQHKKTYCWTFESMLFSRFSVNTGKENHSTYYIFLCWQSVRWTDSQDWLHRFFSFFFCLTWKMTFAQQLLNSCWSAQTITKLQSELKKKNYQP